MNRETLAVMKGPRGYKMGTHEEHTRQIRLGILEELVAIRELLEFIQPTLETIAEQQKGAES